MPRRTIYRDYRKGKKGQFASRASFNRSQSQGVKCHIHREYISDVIDDIDELFDIEDEPGLIDEEIHATGDTPE